MEETGWRRTNSSFFIGGAGAIDDSGGQNSNFTNNIAWDNWDNNIISTSVSVTSHAAATPNNNLCALFFNSAFNNNNNNNNSDPNIMCLKLGKRHYCEDPVVVPDRHVTVAESSSSTVTKRGKPPYHPYDTFVATAGVRVASTTRCQVEGCHVALGNVKEYYRRHKVCEIHSKAPKVVVSGLLQRFCQQCSRFHDITEFDDTKRSCRRRLQGHNLRRRKGTISNSLPRNFQHSLEYNSAMERHLGPLSTLPSSKSKPVHALSLLSSPKADPWISSSIL